MYVIRIAACIKKAVRSYVLPAAATGDIHDLQSMHVANGHTINFPLQNICFRTFSALCLPHMGRRSNLKQLTNRHGLCRLNQSTEP